MSTLPHEDPRCIEDDDQLVTLVVEGKPRGVDSITVARVLPAAKRRMIGPFILLDHVGPVELSPGVGFDVRPHPHIGLSTVTYFFQGENVHRDSLGTVQKNVPGDLNIMTAGRGVVHSERADPEFRARGGVMHGVQIWLALPTDREEDAPSFQHHPEATLPAIAPARGVTGRLLLGERFGARSPVSHPSEPVLIDLQLDAGSTIDVPPGGERGVFVIDGELQIDRVGLQMNRLAVLRDASSVQVTALARTRALVLGGPTLGQRFIEWNFVSSAKDRIARASAAWRAQTFPKIPGDDQEFIALPELRR